MNKAQAIDYAYHADRLLLLTIRKAKLPADSDQIPALDIEIMSIADLVRSYRLVQEHEPRHAWSPGALFGELSSTAGIRV
jgi:hypothetical protein